MICDSDRLLKSQAYQVSGYFIRIVVDIAMLKSSVFLYFAHAIAYVCDCDDIILKLL